MWNGMMEYNRRMEWKADKLDDFNVILTPYKITSKQRLPSIKPPINGMCS